MGWASAGAWAYPTTEYGGLVFVYMGATRLQFDLGRPVQGSNKVHQAAGLSVECSISPRPGLMPRQIEGYDPPEGWGWCYVDEIMLDLSDRATPQNGPIPRYY
jgi:hypothetical protein